MNLLANLTRPAGDPKIIRSGPSSLGAADRMAKFLGWFSIGLGLTEVLAPRSVTQRLGLYGSEWLVRLFGVREIASGMLTLSPDKNVGLSSRVVGDLMDMAVLFRALRGWNPQRSNAKLALAAVAGVTVLDIIATLAVMSQHSRKVGTKRGYEDRSGLPRGVEASRGLAKTRNAAHQPGNVAPAFTH